MEIIKYIMLITTILLFNINAKAYNIIKNQVRNNEYYVIKPTPINDKELNLIIFLHGKNAVTPFFYEGFIDHLLSRNNMILFPIFQKIKQKTSKEDFTLYAYEAIYDFMLSNKYSFNAHNVMYIGHSAGGRVAFNLAVISKEVNTFIPYPSGIFAMSSAHVFDIFNDEWFNADLTDLSILTDTKVLLISGSDDKIVDKSIQLALYESLPDDIFKEIIFFTDKGHYFPMSMTSGFGLIDNGIKIIAKPLKLNDYGITKYDKELWDLYDKFEDFVFYGKPFKIDRDY
jgi:pimeloyl-ACP methyl ester carboxylesterase